jgi:hypothetical protein
MISITDVGCFLYIFHDAHSTAGHPRRKRQLKKQEAEESN